MILRKVKRMVRGQHTVDGAGVHLVRVLGGETVRDYDPFLMLDSFDSKAPSDYIKGFPMHPHRGIETITYLAEGEIIHKDSLGNSGMIRGGDSQWMTAGSGIMHEEMPQATEWLLGVQLWLNLPKTEKMTQPTYFDVTKDKVGLAETDFGVVRVLAGAYADVEGAKPPHWPVTIYDVTVKASHQATIPVHPDENVFVFLLLGDAVIDGRAYASKSAVLFEEEGDAISVHALADAPCRWLLCSGRKIKEPVAWGGPIVMNTEEELEEAFLDLRTGNFIRHRASQH